MDKQRPTAYNGRFNDSAGIGRGEDTYYRASSRPTDSARRPSGFGTAGQAAKAKPAPEPEPKKSKKARPEKTKKEKRVREDREPGKNHPILRGLLIAAAAVVLLSALMVLIFGGEDTTYHQMPTIERESIAHFEPEATPIPGVEDL